MKAVPFLLLALLVACGEKSAPPPAPPKRVEVTPKPVEAPAPSVPKAEPIVRDLDAIREAAALRGETMGYEQRSSVKPWGGSLRSGPQKVAPGFQPGEGAG